MNKTMKPIPGYDGYFATTSGEIWSGQRKNLRRLMPIPHRKVGYLYVHLQINKKPKTPYVHKLILLAFVGPKPDGCQTRHLNGIRTDNRLENLCWGTPQENTDDKFAHGTTGAGGAGRPIRLTADGARSIRLRLAAGTKVIDLAREYGVSTRTIYGIKLNQWWRSA